MYCNRAARAVVVLSIFCGFAFAGDLNPPAGPVAPTMKPLSDVEPRIAVNALNTPGDANAVFVISLPGSYYLTGNVLGMSGRHGINITSSNVELDLNGFDLVGVPGALNGVNIGSGARVHNGTIRNWPQNGVQINSAVTAPNELTRIVVVQNGAHGISSAGPVRVLDSTASFNGIDGFDLSASSYIARSLSNNNGRHGFSVPSGTAIECRANSNIESGFRVTGVGSRVSGSVASYNFGPGFFVTGDTLTVVNCTSHDNSGGGIVANSDNSLIAECTVNYNSLFGVSVTSAANVVIRDNVIGNNGGSQILLSASNCTVENNRMRTTSSSAGVTISAGANNLVVRNYSAGLGTGYSIIAGNVVGPILSGAGTITSTNPWANFDR